MQARRLMVLVLILLGVVFIFKNTTSELLVGSLLWVDHNFDVSYPVTMIMAEIDPGEEFRGNYTYKGRRWILRWAGWCRGTKYDKEENIEVNESTTMVISTPTEVAKLLEGT
jgi:hypothetical protein